MGYAGLPRGTALHRMALRFAEFAPRSTSWCAVFGTAVFLYLIYTVPREQLIGGSDALLLCAAGVFVSAIGMIFFFGELLLNFTTAGDSNRVTIIAAIGAAAVLTGVSSILSAWIAGRHSTAMFASIVAIICASNCLVVNTIANFWANASVRQSQVLAALRSVLPSIPVSATLLVGGFCSYDGPAVVFETTWDMTGVLRIAYADPTVNADMVNRRTTYTGGEITTRAYDENVYTVGRSLLLIDVAARTAQILSKTEDVRQDLVPMLLSNQCPAAAPGQGTPIF